MRRQIDATFPPRIGYSDALKVAAGHAAPSAPGMVRAVEAPRGPCGGSIHLFHLGISFFVHHGSGITIIRVMMMMIMMSLLMLHERRRLLLRSVSISSRVHRRVPRRGIRNGGGDRGIRIMQIVRKGTVRSAATGPVAPRASAGRGPVRGETIEAFPVQPPEDLIERHVPVHPSRERRYGGIGTDADGADAGLVLREAVGLLLGHGGAAVVHEEDGPPGRRRVGRGGGGRGWNIGIVAEGRTDVARSRVPSRMSPDGGVLRGHEQRIGNLPDGRRREHHGRSTVSSVRA